jgi:hypothetical protein
MSEMQVQKDQQDDVQIRAREIRFVTFWWFQQRQFLRQFRLLIVLLIKLFVLRALSSWDDPGSFLFNYQFTLMEKRQDARFYIL